MDAKKRFIPDISEPIWKKIVNRILKSFSQRPWLSLGTVIVGAIWLVIFKLAKDEPSVRSSKINKIDDSAVKKSETNNKTDDDSAVKRSETHKTDDDSAVKRSETHKADDDSAVESNSSVRKVHRNKVNFGLFVSKEDVGTLFIRKDEAVDILPKEGQRVFATLEPKKFIEKIILVKDGTKSYKVSMLVLETELVVEGEILKNCILFYFEDDNKTFPYFPDKGILKHNAQIKISFILQPKTSLQTNDSLDVGMNDIKFGLLVTSRHKQDNGDILYRGDTVLNDHYLDENKVPVINIQELAEIKYLPKVSSFQANSLNSEEITACYCDVMINNKDCQSETLNDCVVFCYNKDQGDVLFYPNKAKLAEFSQSAVKITRICKPLPLITDPLLNDLLSNKCVKFGLIMLPPNVQVVNENGKLTAKMNINSKHAINSFPNLILNCKSISLNLTDKQYPEINLIFYDINTQESKSEKAIYLNKLKVCHKDDASKNRELNNCVFFKYLDGKSGKYNRFISKPDAIKDNLNNIQISKISQYSQ